MTSKRLESWHEMALILLALCIPLGEGAGLLAMGLVVLCCALRHRELPWRELVEGIGRFWFGGWMLWLGVGLVMIVGSGQGVLKSSEIFRHVPILAAPALFLSARSLSCEALERAARYLLIALCVSALFGIMQWLIGEQPLLFLVRADSSVAAQSRIPGAFGHAAATGFYFHRLKMAHVLVLGIAMVLPSLLLIRKNRLLKTLCCAVMTICLIGTFAKASWGACAVAVTMTGYCLFRQIRIPLLLVALLSLLGVWLSVDFSSDILGERLRDSVMIRTMIWSQAVEVLRDYPGGVGLGNYSQIISRYYDQVMPAFHIRTYPHHLMLSWWVECGSAGMLAVLTGWVTTFIFAIKGAADSQEELVNRVSYMTLGFYLCVFWIIGLAHDVFYHQSVALMFFSGIGWLLGRLPYGKAHEIE